MIKLDSRKASVSFKALLAQLGQQDVIDILANWEDAWLSEDGDTIFQFIGRDRQYSRGSLGGKVRLSKKEFLMWLLGDGPFDPRIFGDDIRNNSEWVAKIETARRATGLAPDEVSQP